MSQQGAEGLLQSCSLATLGFQNNPCLRPPGQAVRRGGPTTFTLTLLYYRGEPSSLLTLGLPSVAADSKADRALPKSTFECPTPPPVPMGLP